MRIFIVCLLCALSHIALAQGSYEYRYWFDVADASVQTGTITDNKLHLDIDVSSLPLGLHTFNCHVSDTSGLSITKTALFYNYAFEEANTFEYRYWFDAVDKQATHGKATNGAATMAIDASSLPTGLHTFNYQLIKAGRGESITKTALFYKYPYTKKGGYSYRYWFDSADELATTGTATSNIMPLDIDASALPTGLHTFNFQMTHDGIGESVTKTALFYKYAYSEEGGYSYRYWFDNADKLAVTGSTIGEIAHLNIDTEALNVGLHTFNFQLMDKNGNYSVPKTSLFYKMATEDALTGMNLYYMVDENPITFYPATWVNGGMHADLDMSTLTVGEHTITFFCASKEGITTQLKTATFYRDTTNSVTSVQLDVNKLVLPINETYQLKVTVLPEDAIDKRCFFKSSNPSVATVSETGVITAISEGVAQILVTTQDAKKTATCEVTVTTPIDTIYFDPWQYQTINKDGDPIVMLFEGESEHLKVIISPSNATNKNVIWTSTDPSIATVNDGLLTAIKSGITFITVATEDGKKSARCQVVVLVRHIYVEDVVLDQTSMELAVGKTTQLVATILPDSATNKNVVWESFNPAVATVSQTGVVKAISPGVAHIQVTTEDGNKTATCEVKVLAPVLVEKVTINTTSLNLQIGKTAQLTATVSPTTASNKSVTWKSSNTSIVSVSSTGLVTAVGNGTATITVTTADGAKTATCTVTVTTAVTNVTLDKTTLALLTGKTAQLTATVSPTNASNKAVTWKSSNTSIANVSSTGLVTAVGNGTATITVTTADGAKTATCTVTVTTAVTNVTLDKTTLALLAGKSEQLTATVSPTNASNKAVTWKSSNTSIANVSSTGLVTAVGNGTATITVTTADGAKTATCTVTVTTAVEDVVLDESLLELAVGNSAHLTATVLPENATNKNVVWSSSDEDIATVVDGMVQGVAEGEAWITVTTEDGNYSAECQVFVRIPVTGITLDELVLGVTIGTVEELHVHVLPEDATNKNVVFESNDPTIASVEQTDGVCYVTGLKEGTCKVIAKTEDGGFVAISHVIVLSNLQSGDDIPYETIEPLVRKISEKGIVYIIYKGQRYTIQGQKVE